MYTEHQASASRSGGGSLFCFLEASREKYIFSFTMELKSPSFLVLVCSHKLCKHQHESEPGKKNWNRRFDMFQYPWNVNHRFKQKSLITPVQNIYIVLDTQSRLVNVQYCRKYQGFWHNRKTPWHRVAPSTKQYHGKTRYMRVHEPGTARLPLKPFHPT